MCWLTWVVQKENEDKLKVLELSRDTIEAKLPTVGKGTWLAPSAQSTPLNAVVLAVAQTEASEALTVMLNELSALLTKRGKLLEV